MDEANKKFELAGKTYVEGDWISLNGSTGDIYDGAVPTTDATIGGEFGRVMGWCDQYRDLQVRTNADTPTTPLRPASSALRASACAAPSTCSSRASASAPSAA